MKNTGFAISILVLLAGYPWTTWAQVFVYAAPKAKGRSPAQLYKLAFAPNERGPIQLVRSDFDKNEIPLRKEGYVYLPVSSVPPEWLGPHLKNAVLIRTSVDSEARRARIDVLLNDQKFYALSAPVLDIPHGDFLEAAYVSDKINLYSVVNWEGKKSLYFQVDEGMYKGRPKILNLEDSELIRPIPSPDGRGFFILVFSHVNRKLVIYQLTLKKNRTTGEHEVEYLNLNQRGINLRDAQLGIVGNSFGNGQPTFKLFLIQSIYGRQQISSLNILNPGQPRIAAYQMPTRQWDDKVPLVFYSSEMPSNREQRSLILGKAQPAIPHIYGKTPQVYERPHAQLAPDVPDISEVPPPPCNDFVK